MRISRRGIWQVGVAHNRRGWGGRRWQGGSQVEQTTRERGLRKGPREDMRKRRQKGNAEESKEECRSASKKAQGSKTQRLTLELGPDLSWTSLDLGSLDALTFGSTDV